MSLSQETLEDVRRTVFECNSYINSAIDLRTLHVLSIWTWAIHILTALTGLTVPSTE